MERSRVNSADESADAGGNKKIKILPVSLFLLVPALYVFGESYWSAWLTAYGLTSAVLPLSVDEAVYKAYEAALMVGLAYMPILASVGLLLLSLLILWASSALLLFIWGLVGDWLMAVIDRALQLAQKWVARNRSKITFTAQSYALGAMPLLLWGAALYCFVILLIPLMLGHCIGKWQGEKSSKEFRQRISDRQPKVEDQLIVLSGQRGELYLVACSEHGCGGINSEGSRFVRWDDIEQIHKAKSRKP